ncbi:MAG: ABC transporter substrate-binding protein, partial [Actinobacteria bacterium]|nr:ABC transporter substrate-binding protein [Actinomycetota bacterium]
MSTPSGQSAPSAASTPAGGAATAGGPLILGTLLAATGPLASYALPEFAGMGAAVDAVNAAGGVLGMPVQTIDGDSGNTHAVASLSLERSIGKGAQVIIGATTSTMSLSVIDQAVAAGVLLFSPSNTAVKLSDPAITQGLYFRTAPPDSYEGLVLAGLAFDEGKRSVAIMQIDDAYGAELADSFTLAFKERNGRVVAREVYNPAASSFADNVAKVKAAKP